MIRNLVLFRHNLRPTSSSSSSSVMMFGHHLILVLVAASILSCLLSTSVVLVVNAFANGAGSCVGGQAAVGSPHLRYTMINTGSLRDAGIECQLDGVGLVASNDDGDDDHGNGIMNNITLLLSTDIVVEHTITVSIVNTNILEFFRGIFIRLEGDGVTDTTILPTTTTADNNVEINTFCGEISNVTGITHNNASNKTTVTLILDVSDLQDALSTNGDSSSSTTLSLEVTIVGWNTFNDGSSYYYSAYVLTLQQQQQQQHDDDDDDDVEYETATQDDERTVSPAPALDDDIVDMDSNDVNVVDVIANDDELERFATAINVSGSVTPIRESIAITIFAPTDHAWGKFNDQEYLNKLLGEESWMLHLQNLLLFHTILDQTLDSEKLEDGKSFATGNGEIVLVVVDHRETVSISYTGSFVRVQTLDVDGSNGVIHKIDSVMTPAFVSEGIITKLDNLGSYSTFMTIIASSGLDGILKSSDLTLFAPNDAAFAKIPTADLDSLLDPSNAAALVLNHVIVAPPIYPSVLLHDEMTLPTEAVGGYLKFTVQQGNNNTITINGIANVLDAESDCLVYNGIIHGIDTVLLPPTPATLPAPPGDDNNDNRTTVAHIVDSEEDLKILAAFFGDIGMDTTLNDIESLTFFAPTDSALSLGVRYQLEKYLQQPGWTLHVENMILFHLTEEVLLSMELMDGMELLMFNNESLVVSIAEENVVTVNSNFSSANVTESDYVADNGVLHKIDRLLLPSLFSIDVLTLLGGDDEYSKLLELIVIANLDVKEATLFAPTNAAFEDTEMPTDTDAVRAVLLYHVVRDTGGRLTIYPSVDLLSGIADADGAFNLVTADKGLPMTVSLNDDGGIILNDGEATVINFDLLASNGIVHGIDSVLLPPDTLAPTTTSPAVSPPTSSPTTRAPSEVSVSSSSAENIIWKNLHDVFHFGTCFAVICMVVFIGL